MNILRGINVPPIIVGLARGIAEAAVMAGLLALFAAVGAFDFGDKAYLAPVVLGGVRFLEGAADHIDESTKRAP